MANNHPKYAIVLLTLDPLFSDYQMESFSKAKRGTFNFVIGTVYHSKMY